MKRSSKKKFLQTTALFGTSLFIGFGAGIKTYNENDVMNIITNKDKNYNTDYDNSNKDFISDINKAKELGYLMTNPTKPDLIATVNGNKNITNKYGVQTYFYQYINSLCEKFPDLDKSILQKNIELIKINYLTKEEMCSLNDEYTMAFFSPSEHTLNLCTDYEIDKVIFHEISHMLRHIYYQCGNTIIYSQFSDGSFGDSLDEEINTTFTNRVLYNETGYQTKNINLLYEIIGEEDLYDIYFNGDIYTLIQELNEINPALCATELIGYNDLQIEYYFDSNAYNNLDADVNLYESYIDYFMSMEEKKGFENFDDDCDLFLSIIKDDITNTFNTNIIVEDFNNEKQKIYTKK